MPPKLLKVWHIMNGTCLPTNKGNPKKQVFFPLNCVLMIGTVLEALEELF